MKCPKCNASDDNVIFKMSMDLAKYSDGLDDEFHLTIPHRCLKCGYKSSNWN